MVVRYCDVPRLGREGIVEYSPFLLSSCFIFVLAALACRSCDLLARARRIKRRLVVSIITDQAAPFVYSLYRKRVGYAYTVRYAVTRWS